MSPEQRDILIASVQDDGNEYDILTIEYPHHYEWMPGERVAKGGDDGLKIVSRLVESTRVDVDIYRPDGSVETSGFYERRT